MEWRSPHTQLTFMAKDQWVPVVSLQFTDTSLFHYPLWTRKNSPWFTSLREQSNHQEDCSNSQLRLYFMLFALLLFPDGHNIIRESERKRQTSKCFYFNTSLMSHKYVSVKLIKQCFHRIMDAYHLKGPLGVTLSNLLTNTGILSTLPDRFM